MIGTPTALAVRVSRKTSDGEYGSFEVSAELTVNLPPEVDLEQAFDASDAWLTAAVGASMAEKRGMIAKSKPAPEPVTVAAVLTDNGPAVVVQAPETAATYEVIEVRDFVPAVSESGAKFAKVHGGRWMKFGVKAWPETMKTIGVDLDTLELGQPHTMPAGYAHARIEMDGEKPKKVYRFEK